MCQEVDKETLEQNFSLQLLFQRWYDVKNKGSGAVCNVMMRGTLEQIGDKPFFPTISWYGY